MCDMAIKKQTKKRASENRRGERVGAAVEVEIYSGIEFTRLNSTPTPQPPVQEHMVQINWLPVEKKGEEERKESVSGREL